MKLLGDSLAHAMHLATAARTRLLVVGQVILGALARQVRRQRPAAALLPRHAFDGWQARVRKFGDSVRCTAGVILIGDLLGFIEEAVDVLFRSAAQIRSFCCAISALSSDAFAWATASSAAISRPLARSAASAAFKAATSSGSAYVYKLHKRRKSAAAQRLSSF
jgi:hypothetical protein